MCLRRLRGPVTSSSQILSGFPAVSRSLQKAGQHWFTSGQMFGAKAGQQRDFSALCCGMEILVYFIWFPYLLFSFFVLLLSGDVELNPGPTKGRVDRRAYVDGRRVWIPDPDASKCDVCKTTIKSGPFLKGSFGCSAEECPNRSHKACIGCKDSQLRTAKKANAVISWFCSLHGGETKIEMPVQPPTLTRSTETFSGEILRPSGRNG